MPVIPPFTSQTRAPQTTEHDPNDPVHGGLRTSIIPNEVAHVCSFPGGGKEGATTAAGRRPRERENEIASRHAYEIDGRSDIKVVLSVRRGATADKWLEMFAKVAGSARQIIFHPCRANERTKEGEKERFIDVENRVSLPRASR